MHSERRTEETYSFLWKRNRNSPPPNKWHFNNMQEVVNQPIVRGARGIDLGSGCGYDTYIMAKKNPSAKIVSIDSSNGVYAAKELTSELKNVQIIRCSVLSLPLKESIFDFAYSFGVLHHTINPKNGLFEIVRILKKNSPAFLYLYEDHSDSRMKYIIVKIIARLRRITVKIPPKILYFLCFAFSPLVFVILSVPSRLFKRFKATHHLYEKMPFNFASGPFSLRGDLYDRFSAPIEHRFNRQQVRDLFAECGFSKVNIARLNNKAGWVAWGYKK